MDPGQDGQMTEPVPKSTTVTIKNTAASTSEDILTGEHTVSDSIIRLNKEWRPKEPSAQRFKDNVISLLEGMLNNTNTTVPDQGEELPDPPPGGGGSPEIFYDSGYVYFYCDNTDPYLREFKHNMGQVPTQFTVFYSSAANPVVGSDIIYVVTPGKFIDNAGLTIGFDLKVKNKNTMEMSIAKDFISGGGTWGIPPITAGPNEGYIRLMAWR